MYGWMQSHPSDDALALQGRRPAFLHPESPLGAQLGSAALAAGLMVPHPLLTDMAGGIRSPQVVG